MPMTTSLLITISSSPNNHSTNHFDSLTSKAMQTSCLHSLPPPFSISFPNIKLGFSQKKRAFNSVICAVRRDANDKDHHNGRLIDENMIVLRQRIHEMKMVEMNCEPPPHWMEWEKKYYFRSYDSDVVEVVGFLQSSLMETRPGLALGMVILVFFSVLSSMAVVGFCFVDVVKWIFDGIQLSS